MAEASCFLIGIKIVTQEGTHTWFCKPGQEPVTEVIGENTPGEYSTKWTLCLTAL